MKTNPTVPEDGNKPTCRICGSDCCYHCQECGEFVWEHKEGCPEDPSQNLLEVEGVPV